MTKTTVHRFHKEMELGDDDVYVGRPSKWGNPFKIHDPKDRKVVIQMYEDWVLGRVTKPGITPVGMIGRRPSFTVDDIKRELKGKRLFCWCHPRACHADVLAKIADS